MPRNRHMELERIWCAIPVFNNEKTVREVAAGCRVILENVVVIDDGSTDADVTALLAGLDVTLLRHEKNLGKGIAIRTAARYIEDKGGLYMITIDADGQHYPEDIRKFIPLLLESDSDILVGCRDFDTDNVPGKSRFGRKFANFWLRMETGVEIDDCQSGFRAYPVKYLNQMQFKGFHYDFEAEVLAKATWAGLQLRTVPIDVYYPPPGERVSSFKPFLDNLRLSLVHSMLVGRRLLPVRHRKLVADVKKPELTFLRHPARFFVMLLKENATPGGLAMAAAVGIFFGALPLLFVHTLVILYVAARLNLNKIVAVNVQHLCMPPLVPALCIEVGFYLRHGYWLTDLSFATVFAQFSSRLFEWFLGSLIVAPAGSILVGAVFYTTASLFKKARSF